MEHNQEFAIQTEGLSKVYRCAKRTRGALRALFAPEYDSIEAVSGVSIEVPAGQRVAFIGPNGAGKSTTIKMLTGILHPSGGEAAVAGLVPWRDRARLSYRIGTVFGQRSQLWYHLPAGETFNLFARIYELAPAAYAARRRELTELFELGPLLEKPVRQLSLGERMRCELAASMLHRPRVLLLDEPSIGLDVTAKAVIRDLLRRQSEREGMTLLLTSHDTGDMEQVCERVIVINHGRVLLDTSVEGLRTNYLRRKYVEMKLADETLTVALTGVSLIAQAPHAVTLEVDTSVCAIEQAVHHIMQRVRIRDLTVEDPPMEEVIKALYAAARREDQALQEAAP